MFDHGRRLVESVSLLRVPTHVLGRGPQRDEFSGTKHHPDIRVYNYHDGDPDHDDFDQLRDHDGDPKHEFGDLNLILTR